MWTQDEKTLSQALAHNLKSEGLAVGKTLTGTGGTKLVVASTYEPIIIDIVLLVLDASRSLVRIRARNCQIPILTRTAKEALQDEVKHFKAGADDYLTTPFAFGELPVRVESLLRRREARQTQKLHVGDLGSGWLAHEVTCVHKVRSCTSQGAGLDVSVLGGICQAHHGAVSACGAWKAPGRQ